MEQNTDVENTYQLSLEGDGITVERTISEDIARSVIRIVMGGSTGATRAGNDVGRRDNHTPTRSLREYMDSVEAQRHADKIVTIGNYLVDELGRDGFSTDDIKSQFRTAGEAIPGNYPRDFRWTVTNGWIAEDHNAPGTYYVTQKGKNAIEQKFSADVRKATRMPQKGKRRQRKGDSSASDE